MVFKFFSRFPRTDNASQFYKNFFSTFKLSYRVCPRHVFTALPNICGFWWNHPSLKGAPLRWVLASPTHIRLGNFFFEKDEKNTLAYFVKFQGRRKNV
jgi:hypothetical protein